VKWKINIVTPRWLSDSVKAGHCLPESGYSVVGSASSSKSGLTTSTPTNRDGLFIIIIIVIMPALEAQSKPWADEHIGTPTLCQSGKKDLGVRR